MTSANEGQSSSSVTVSITRKVDPLRVNEVTAWIQSGVNLASRWPGFLGSGWIRSSLRTDEWYMLYRFEDPSSLSAWEGSSCRQSWLDQGAGLVEERRVEKLTGIEGWFDSSPQSHEASVSPPTKARQVEASCQCLACILPCQLDFCSSD